MIQFLRLAYAKTDPRNRHGAWHVAANERHALCGMQFDPKVQWQRANRETWSLPPGTACLACITLAANKWPAARADVEREKENRRRRR